MGATLLQHGGAIYNSGGLTLIDCALTNNIACNCGSGTGANGGAIFNAGGASLTLLRCTFSGNSAPDLFGGGAIFNAGTLTATNCTFIANSAPRGGAILSIANNGTSLVDAAQLHDHKQHRHLRGYFERRRRRLLRRGAVGNPLHHFSNTILAGNSNGVNPDLRGYGTSEGNNLIQNLGLGGSGFVNGVNGDKVGVNPGVGFFGNHGGPTDTVSLLSTSPARDAGNDALAPATDQRDFGRSGISDIGAFEFSGVAPTPSPTPTPVPTPLPTPTPIATPTPAPTATPTPNRFANISTRLRVETGGQRAHWRIHRHRLHAEADYCACARTFASARRSGFRIRSLELFNGSGSLLASNDNWQEAANAQEIIDSTIPPPKQLESAILRNVEPGAYTAVVRDVADGEGRRTGRGL